VLLNWSHLPNSSICCCLTWLCWGTAGQVSCLNLVALDLLYFWLQGLNNVRFSLLN
jgi:hypothetical protein